MTIAFDYKHLLGDVQLLRNRLSILILHVARQHVAYGQEYSELTDSFLNLHTAITIQIETC